jgi:hypothetical protein
MCQCDPLHESTATVLLSCNVKLNDLPAACCEEVVTILGDCVTWSSSSTLCVNSELDSVISKMT